MTEKGNKENKDDFEQIYLDKDAYEILFDMQKELKDTLGSRSINMPDSVVRIEDLANQAIRDCKAYKEFFEEMRERFMLFNPMGQIETGNE